MNNSIEGFESDARDLCMAFYPLKSEIDISDFYFKRDLNDENRLKIKSELKRQLYNFLSEKTGKKLLWGTLTGIRPVTIVINFLESENYPDDTVYKRDFIKYNGDPRKFLKDEFYVSEEKIDELLDIAYRELNILKRHELKEYKDSYSIYVGVPFCKSTCLYCSFTSFNIEKYKEYVEKYLDKLEEEFKKELHWDRFAPSEKNGYRRIYSPMTLYIGGGTPTSLSENDFERLLSIIDKYVQKETLVEYTVEAGRPDTITKEKLLSMKKHGVTRISINPQSMNQKTLDLIGRKHTTKEIIEKFKLAREVGFDNINMDIIIGLPDEHIMDVLKTAIGIARLKPDSLTVHSLALKRAARLNYELESWTKDHYLAGLDDRKPEGKRTIDIMFSIGKKMAKLLGLNPYYLYRQKNMAGNLENVGYTKNGKECIYNIMMMSERHTVFGFGCATTKEVYYDGANKRVESIEGYKSVVDYCK